MRVCEEDKTFKVFMIPGGSRVRGGVRLWCEASYDLGCLLGRPYTCHERHARRWVSYLLYWKYIAILCRQYPVEISITFAHEHGSTDILGFAGPEERMHVRLSAHAASLYY